MSRYAGFHLLPSEKEECMTFLVCSCSKCQSIVKSQVWSCTQLFLFKAPRLFFPTENTKEYLSPLTKHQELLCNGGGKELHWAGAAQGTAVGFLMPGLMRLHFWAEVSICGYPLSLAELNVYSQRGFSESTEDNVGGDLSPVMLWLWCSLTACISQTRTLHYLMDLAIEAIKPLSQPSSPSYKVVRHF